MTNWSKAECSDWCFDPVFNYDYGINGSVTPWYTLTLHGYYGAE